MRRLLTVLLAYGVMWSQGLAPAAASLAAARSLDPLNHAIICSALVDTSQGSKDHHGPSDDHCPQCFVAVASFAVAPSKLDLFVAPQLVTPIVWQISADCPDRTFNYSVPQARAPPNPV
jgi:hypothetical protein